MGHIHEIHTELRDSFGESRAKDSVVMRLLGWLLQQHSESVHNISLPEEFVREMRVMVRIAIVSGDHKEPWNLGTWGDVNGSVYCTPPYALSAPERLST
jgi:hypothetical protein